MRVNKYTKEILEQAIKQSKSWSDVCRIVGTDPKSGSQHHIKQRAELFGLDFSHFLGKGWALGKEGKHRKKLGDYLSNKLKIKSHALKLKLIQAGLKEEKCELCGLSIWLGQKIPLELDHKNSNHFDNTLTNLQIICPNCHSCITKQRKI